MSGIGGSSSVLRHDTGKEEGLEDGVLYPISALAMGFLGGFKQAASQYSVFPLKIIVVCIKFSLVPENLF